MGLKDSVTDAFTYTLTLLQKYNKAVTCADYVSWMYEEPNTQARIKHPLLANLELESSFKVSVLIEASTLFKGIATSLLC